MKSVRHSYYFPPNELVSEIYRPMTDGDGTSFKCYPNHYVFVDLTTDLSGLVVANLSVSLPRSHTVDASVLPKILVGDKEYLFEQNSSGSFTNIKLTPYEVTLLKLELDGIKIGEIEIDSNPALPGVAVRFSFDIGSPTKR